MNPGSQPNSMNGYPVQRGYQYVGAHGPISMAQFSEHDPSNPYRHGMFPSLPFPHNPFMGHLQNPGMYPHRMPMMNDMSRMQFGPMNYQDPLRSNSSDNGHSPKIQELPDQQGNFEVKKPHSSQAYSKSKVKEDKSPVNKKGESKSGRRHKLPSPDVVLSQRVGHNNKKEAVQTKSQEKLLLEYFNSYPERIPPPAGSFDPKDIYSGPIQKLAMPSDEGDLIAETAPIVDENGVFTGEYSFQYMLVYQEDTGDKKSPLLWSPCSEDSSYEIDDQELYVSQCLTLVREKKELLPAVTLKEIISEASKKLNKNLDIIPNILKVDKGIIQDISKDLVFTGVLFAPKKWAETHVNSPTPKTSDSSIPVTPAVSEKKSTVDSVTNTTDTMTSSSSNLTPGLGGNPSMLPMPPGMSSGMVQIPTSGNPSLGSGLMGGVPSVGMQPSFGNVPFKNEASGPLTQQYNQMAPNPYQQASQMNQQPGLVSSLTNPLQAGVTSHQMGGPGFMFPQQGMMAGQGVNVMQPNTMSAATGLPTSSAYPTQSGQTASLQSVLAKTTSQVSSDSGISSSQQIGQRIPGVSDVPVTMDNSGKTDQPESPLASESSKAVVSQNTNYQSRLMSGIDPSLTGAPLLTSFPQFLNMGNQSAITCPFTIDSGDPSVKIDHVAIKKEAMGHLEVSEITLSDKTLKIWGMRNGNIGLMTPKNIPGTPCTYMHGIVFFGSYPSYLLNSFGELVKQSYTQATVSASLALHSPLGLYVPKESNVGLTRFNQYQSLSQQLVYLPPGLYSFQAKKKYEVPSKNQAN